MPGPSETLPALDWRLAERLDAAWPRGRIAIERAEIGRYREDALSGIVALRDRIATRRAETLANAAVQPTDTGALRRASMRPGRPWSGRWSIIQVSKNASEIGMGERE